MNSNSTEKGIRKFGIIAFVFFGALCALGLWRNKPIPTYLFGALAVLGFGFLLIPRPLRPIHDAWLRIGHLVGRIITLLSLAIVYYLVITPTSFIKRLLGGAPLPLKPDKEASTYWVSRSEPAQPKERFLKRY
ncbi:MAG: hypothetical protein SWE60_05775 [Thermodesulfobacteriota bacterium]|nr:hypothetical protein [Thermodesulfobacteriota bacterium]